MIRREPFTNIVVLCCKEFYITVKKDKISIFKFGERYNGMIEERQMVVYGDEYTVHFTNALFNEHFRIILKRKMLKEDKTCIQKKS